MDFDGVGFSDHKTIQVIKAAHEGDAFSAMTHQAVAGETQQRCSRSVLMSYCWTERVVQTGVDAATHPKYGQKMSIEKFESSKSVTRMSKWER